MTNQPYKFAQGNPAGSLAQSVSGFIAGGLKQRSGVQEKLMEHNMRLREMKKEGKQVRKTIRTQGEVNKELAFTKGSIEEAVQKSKIKETGKQNRKLEKAKAKAAVRSAEGMAKAAQTLGATAAPGTRVGITPQKAEYTTPKPSPAPAPASPARAPKPKMRASMRGKTY